jgi:decaprenylphospho-beta-D-erythro-pentofuranosid-2-ulose 2-reductase
MRKFERALVIGASSGIGLALAEQLLKEGSSVAMLSRRSEPMQALASSSTLKTSLSGKAFVYAHDVTNYAEVPALFQQITNDLGGLDLVIYSSGVMPTMDEHEYNFEKDRETIEVNVLGAFAWLNEAAKRFEQLKGASPATRGTIIGISSVAGERGRRGNPAYCTSKAAFSTYLESLRNRLSRFGVKVITIKPGFIDTPMTRGKPGLFWVISAETAAKRILSLAQGIANTVYVPSRWRYVSFLLKCIPSFIFSRLPI